MSKKNKRRFPWFSRAKSKTQAPRAKRRTSLFESLEARHLLAGDVASAWCNPNLNTDVDGDGATTTLDLTYLVDQLLAGGNRDLGAPPAQNLSAQSLQESEGSSTDQLFVDVDGDNRLTTADLTMLVDRLLAQESEGESARIKVSYKATLTNDRNAAAVTEVGVGTNFFVHVFVTDQRLLLGESVTVDQLGVSGAGLDLTYTSNVSPVFTAFTGDATAGNEAKEVVFESDFAFRNPSNGNLELGGISPGGSFDTTKFANTIDNMEAVYNGRKAASSGDPQLLATLQFSADSAGMVVFTGVNDADRVFSFDNPVQQVVHNEVFYGSLSVNVLSSPGAVDDVFPTSGTIDEDSDFVTLDVLANDYIDGGTLSITGVSNITGGATVEVASDNLSV
ncbi:MAG: hypothetical protein KDA71_02520, partial [Planctomycetales bacterium]|nr:hypothetical protein [Planctomycetales bacterium]